MKKLPHLAMLLTAALALASFVPAFAPAQQTGQPQGQGDQDKLVQIVRNATQQY